MAEERNTRPLEFVIWSGLVLVMLMVTLAYVKERLIKDRGRQSGTGQQVVRLSPELQEKKLPVIGTMPEFTLTNQLGQMMNRDSLTGRVWLADIIFTRCPGPCARMTQRMGELQKLIPDDLPIGFLSLTTDPEFDTPSILNLYGKRAEADTNRWFFLTGPKSEIGKLSTEGLKLVGKEKAEGIRENPNDLFIHSTVFALIDKRGQLLGVREILPPPSGEDVRAPLVDPWETELKPEILRAIEQLLKEQ